jgi:hypothetical protein
MHDTKRGQITGKDKKTCHIKIQKILDVARVVTFF